MTLPELSAAATQGEWFAGPLTANDDDQRFISIGPYDLSDRPNKSHHYEDTILEVWDNPNNDGEPEANAAFIVALVNAYRTNQLVERDGVAGVVEACANIVGKAMTEADINGRDEVSDELYQVQCAIYNLDTTALTAIKGGDHD